MELPKAKNPSVIGVFIGKFFPPHIGHASVIAQALSMCEKLYIIVCAIPDSSPSGQLRAYWLQQLAPQAEILLTDDLCEWHFDSPCVDSCTDVWSQRLKDLVPEKVDLVFTSEEYGDAFAAAISATHVSVDRGRKTHPVSATNIRTQLNEYWNFLPRIVRAGLYRKIVIIGAESTGTTTLARDLAVSLNAPWVAEVGRTISWELAIRAGGIEKADWNEEVFWRVLREQSRAEVDAVHGHCDTVPSVVGPWLVCDTDAIATVVWWDRYLATPSVNAMNFAQPYLGDLYVITDPQDVVFVQDGLRDGEHLRHEMHNSFVEIARQTKKPVVVATGSRQERVSQLITEIEKHEKEHPRFSPT